MKKIQIPSLLNNKISSLNHINFNKNLFQINKKLYRNNVYSSSDRIEFLSKKCNLRNIL